jgi:hypothetical protein
MCFCSCHTLIRHYTRSPHLTYTQTHTRECNCELHCSEVRNYHKMSRDTILLSSLSLVHFHRKPRVRRRRSEITTRARETQLRNFRSLFGRSRKKQELNFNRLFCFCCRRCASSKLLQSFSSYHRSSEANARAKWKGKEFAIYLS